MKDIKELPITLQMALAIKTPELFNKKEFDRLMKMKDVIYKKMYKSFTKIGNVLNILQKIGYSQVIIMV